VGILSTAFERTPQDLAVLPVPDGDGQPRQGAEDEALEAVAEALLGEVELGEGPGGPDGQVEGPDAASGAEEVLGLQGRVGVELGQEGGQVGQGAVPQRAGQSTGGPASATVSWTAPTQRPASRRNRRRGRSCWVPEYANGRPRMTLWIGTR
jgi:hypothetical protein